MTLKDSGKKIASLLVAHGANLEYQDIALRSSLLLSSPSSSLQLSSVAIFIIVIIRNTLFWVVYNNSRELAYFVIQVLPRWCLFFLLHLFYIDCIYLQIVRSSFETLELDWPGTFTRKHEVSSAKMIIMTKSTNHMKYEAPWEDDKIFTSSPSLVLITPQWWWSWW